MNSCATSLLPKRVPNVVPMRTAAHWLDPWAVIMTVAMATTTVPRELFPIAVAIGSLWKPPRLGIKSERELTAMEINGSVLKTEKLIPSTGIPTTGNLPPDLAMLAVVAETWDVYLKCRCITTQIGEQVTHC